MTNERQEMLEKSATLYFGPWYRQSPCFEATRRAGCTSYDIYNHMYLPGLLRRPRGRVLGAEQRRHHVGRRRGAHRPGHRPGRGQADRLITCRDLTKCAVKQGKYMLVTGARRQHRERPGPAARREEHVVDAARGLRRGPVRPRASLRQRGLDAEVTLPDVHPMQVQGPLAGKTLREAGGRRRSTTSSTTGCEEFEIEGIPVVDQPHRLDGDPGLRGQPAGLQPAATRCGTPWRRRARSSTSVRSRRARHVVSRAASSTTARTSAWATRPST